MQERNRLRLYWENKLVFFNPKGVKVPTAVSVFPDELYQTPRNWAERAGRRLSLREPERSCRSHRD
jgi:hypothetical protein